MARVHDQTAEFFLGESSDDLAEDALAAAIRRI
jgi:hypothetical protein